MSNILYLPTVLYTLLQVILVANAHYVLHLVKHASIRKVVRVVFKDIFWQIVLVLDNVELDFMLLIHLTHNAKNASSNAYRVEQIVLLVQAAMKDFSYSIRIV